MKKHFAVAAGLFGFLALTNAAIAADPLADPGHDWSGGYVGLQGGYGWGDTEPAFEQGIIFGPGDVNYEGFIGGIEAGYQVQNNNFVFGLEVDASAATIDADYVGPGPCIIPGDGCTVDIDWLATARVRAGFALNNFMPFVSGGLAAGGIKGTFDAPACDCEVDDTAFGFVLGAGVEWAISDSWSMKAEYLYVNLGKPDIDGDNTLWAPDAGVIVDDHELNVVRVGFNYSF